MSRPSFKMVSDVVHIPKWQDGNHNREKYANIVSKYFTFIPYDGNKNTKRAGGMGERGGGA